MRYVVKKAYNIIVQQDDTCNVMFNAPDEIDLVGKDVILTVVNLCAGPNPNMEYSITNGKVTVSGQEITAIILPIDTANKVGDYRWYLRVVGSSTDKITIGKGLFKVVEMGRDS